MDTEDKISKEHIINNSSVRETLISRWIIPEDIKPEPDIKKIERKLTTEDKKWLEKTKKFK
jgi:DNA-damage-inducible protein D